MAALSEIGRFRQIFSQERASTYPGYRKQNQEVITSQIDSLKRYTPASVLLGLVIYGMNHHNEVLNYVDSFRRHLQF